jgi:chromosomal replication initiation ATPase DnaA
VSPQLVLPFEQRANFAREDFIVAPANAEAVAFVDAWPDWPVAAVALHGPSGSGKSHLAATWQSRAGAQTVSAAALSGSVLARLDGARPTVVEDVDSSSANPARDAAIFSLLEHATQAAPILLTGREAPAAWPAALPDLASRFRALLAFPLWAPDDALLAALARKLFADRQLTVPDAVVAHMLRALERSPAAIREFVAAADAKALAEHRAVTVALIREMISAKGNE